MQSRGFLRRLLGLLLKPGLSSMKNVLESLAESVLIPLGLRVAASAADTEIYKKSLGSEMTNLKISNEEMGESSWIS